MNKRDYKKALAYLFNLEKFGMVFGLDNIKWLLDLLDNPHDSFKTVHIAGTNGKGSTAAMLSHILKEEGFRVGKYTSPHLVSFTERITIDEEEITQEVVAELTENLCQKIEQKDRNRFFTFFDFTTAIAFEYFKRQKVDIAIIETGLGGRLDSTNVLQPLLSIITNVDYDHMEQLGSTIEKIAAEKAGIIKEGVPLVTGCSGSAKPIIEARTRELQCPLYILGQNFSYKKKADRVFDYNGIKKQLPDVTVNLDGDHQLANCALSLCAAEVLSEKGYTVSDTSVYNSLVHLKWHGRLEKVHDNPVILLDSAHNVQGMHVLSQFIRTHHRNKKKILIFGVMKDKEYSKMLQEISPLMDTVILTQPNIGRALSPYEMANTSRGIIVTNNTRDAMKQAMSMAGNEDLILVTGSFYTTGEVKTLINEIP